MRDSWEQQIHSGRENGASIPQKLCGINEDNIQERAVNQHLYKVCECATINALNTRAALWKALQTHY